MDPSWYYNRLSNASASFQPSSGASASDYHQQLAGHHAEGNSSAPSASQLIQFNSGFLPPNPYQFYGIPHASKTNPYAAVGQNRALASTAKPSSESRESYSRQQSNVSSTTYFDHQNAATGSSSIGWSQHNSQLANQGAFGVLPHESITSSSPSPKTGSSDYPFNAYSSVNAGHLAPADYKNSSSFTDGKKSSRSQSPVSSTKTGFASFPGVPANLPNYAAHESSSRTGYSSTDKYVSSAPIQQQQSESSKVFQAQQSSSRTADSNLYQETNIREKEATSRSPSFSSPSVKIAHPTKAQSKLYSDVPISSESSRSAEVPRNSEHSSSSQRYASDSKQATGQTHHMPGTGSFYDPLNFPYHYPLPDAATFNRMKSISSELYLASQPIASDCGKKPSPQASQPAPGPVEHVIKPSYPMYNSSLASLPASSPHQHSERSNSCNQNSSSASLYKPATNTNSADGTTIRTQSAHHQNVAYPSVITRAVTTPDAVTKLSGYNDSRLYDRIQDQTSFSKQCWDTGSEKQSALSQSPDSSSHQKKYNFTSVPVYDSNSTDMTSSRHQSSRSSLSAAEKQNSYYDSASAHQTVLQNHSSYRDDPMSIIKDLQQHQSLHNHDSSKSVEKLPTDQSVISNVRKRKSADKHVQNHESSDFYNNRVPPPAHNNVTSQQQQSGSYFPNFSPPSTSRSYPVSQVPMHYTSHAQALMGQHQGMYTPQFFSPFPLPGPSTPAPSTSTSSPSVSTSTPQSPVASQQTTSEKFYPDGFTQAANSSSSQTQLQHPTPTPVEVVPRVVVPNVEEELSFLKDAGPVTMIKSEEERKKSATSGFEACFLKFLQGERETSPPPQNRSARKSAYVKANRADLPIPTLTNGGSGRTAVIPTAPVLCNKAKDKAKVDYDPKDDPRYFPLPKTDADREVSSDSDSDDGPFSTVPLKILGSKSQDRKPVAAVAPRTAMSKVSKASSVATTQPGKRGRKKKPFLAAMSCVPRRETSKRKAKEKGSILLDDGDDEYSGKQREWTDSDSDPAWTPMANKPKTQNVDSSEDESSKKKSHKKSTKLSGHGRKRSKHARSDDDAASTDDERSKKQITGSRGRRRSLNVQGTSVNSNSAKSGDDNDVDGDDAEMYPFKVGEFIVMKTDLNEKWPAIWRVDGKTLLQKFEPFEQKGGMLYRNISTYSGWSPQNGHIYKSVQVIFKTHTRSETVVELLRDEMADDNDEALLEFVKETAKYQDNFEVYLQTLISQALDSNFLTEIFQEQDEYFLSNVKTVDNIVDDRRKRFLLVVNWRPELEASIATWPCYNIIYEIVEDDVSKKCAACDKTNVSARVLLYGQPYNSTTLEGCQPDPRLASEKDFFTCRLCLKRIELYNKVAHQKYLMYIECAKRVNERKQAYGSKETTAILNELLADETWLNQLFRNVRISWAQMDRLEHTLSKN